MLLYGVALLFLSFFAKPVLKKQITYFFSNRNANFVALLFGNIKTRS
jgi:hypothetical protein